MPPLQLALAILCLSQPANLIRWARAPIEVLGFWRLVIAGAALAPAAWKRRAAWTAMTGRERGLTLAAGAFFYVHLWTFVYAAQHTSVARCMVAFSTHPLWTGLGAWLLLGEPPTRRHGLAYLLAAAGVAVLAAGSGGTRAPGFWGDAAGLLSALTFSGYVLSGRRARRVLHNAAFAALVYAVAAALFFADGAASGVAWLRYPAATWLSILGLAFVVTLGGHALFTHLLETLDVGLLSCAKLLEIPLASLGAWLAFGERPGPATFGAFALVSGAVLALLLPKDLEDA